jgi:hypothetical protein
MKECYKISKRLCDFSWRIYSLNLILDFWKHRTFYEYGFGDNMLFWKLKKEYSL